MEQPEKQPVPASTIAAQPRWRNWRPWDAACKPRGLRFGRDAWLWPTGEMNPTPGEMPGN